MVVGLLEESGMQIRQIESTQVYTVSERENQGQAQRKGATSGIAHAALVARRRCRRRPWFQATHVQTL